ncbi:MAG: hypothetical protein JXR78_07595 [Victivallales bacterium]|nr:hypothetical protein [Victivallales bacterium]
MNRKIFVGGGIVLIAVIMSMNVHVRAFFRQYYDKFFSSGKAQMRTVVTPKETLASTKPVEVPAPSSPKTKTAKPDLQVVDVSPEPAQKPTAQPVKATEKTEKAEEDFSPFNYGAEELGGYTPLRGQRTLTDISIKAILRLNGQEPVAVLELRNTKKTFLVRKGDVVRLHDVKDANSIAEVYLQVVNIGKYEVEIIQQQRPDKVIIVR